MTEQVSISDLKDEYVLCRTLGHSWDEMPNPEFSPEQFRTSAGAMALRCVRCTGERYDYIGKDMTVVYRRYIMPPHYNTIAGEGKRPNLRAEMFRRTLMVHKRKGRSGS